MQRKAGTLTLATLFLLPSIPFAAAYPPPPGPPPPEAGIQFRLGLFNPTGDSDFWRDTEGTFTLRASDFDDLMLGVSFVRPVSNEVEIGFNLDVFQETVGSSVRPALDPFDEPDLHDTRLTILPLTADVRFLPGGRYRVRPGGRMIIKPAFYVGAGIGFNFWEYEEYGRFLDLSIVPPEPIPGFLAFRDDGVAFEVHGLAGVELPLGRTTNLLFELRHSISNDDLGGDFSDLPFRELDLGGTAVFGGMAFRF